MSAPNRSVLFVHHRDIVSPYGATVPHYLSTELSESADVHVVCRGGDAALEGRAARSAVTYHRLDTGDVPVVSGILFVALSTLLAGYLGARHRFDAVYSFQWTLVHGWLAAVTGDSRWVVGLQSVPVRQRADFLSSGGGIEPRKRLAFALKSVYAAVVGAALERCTELVCLTEGIRRVTAEEYGIDPADATVVGMGVDVESFAAGEPSSERERDAEWVITYVGSIGGVRGIEHVIDAVATTDRDVEFRIAGDGHEGFIRRMKRKCRELGVDDRVRWYGYVDHEAVPDLLAETDVAISPLKPIESYQISFPAKLLEYMAAGTLVVATEVEAQRSLIDDGRNGYLYEAGADELVAALDRCFDDEPSHPTVRRRARETAAEYDWDVIVDAHRALLFDGATAPAPRRSEAGAVGR